MCGRFTQTKKVEDYAEDVPDLRVEGSLVPSYNIAPTQTVACIVGETSPIVVPLRWGLIPEWARDMTIGARLINARAETITQKPSFRESFKKRRCLVLADGFYEWQRPSGGARKTPYYFRMQTGRGFAFAGLWASWRDPAGTTVETCTIITTAANTLVQPVHHRMPVILPPAEYRQWLAVESSDPNELLSALAPYPANHMEAYPVSEHVNHTKNNESTCIAPAPETML